MNDSLFVQVPIQGWMSDIDRDKPFNGILLKGKWMQNIVQMYET